MALVNLEIALAPWPTPRDPGKLNSCRMKKDGIR